MEGVPKPGEVISYEEMCRREGKRLQKGMNFQPRRKHHVLLMSRRANAPYADLIQDEGRVLIYQGHDARPEPGRPDPKTLDQPIENPDGTPTDNGKFIAAIDAAKRGGPRVAARVYEKLRTSVWVFVGEFLMLEAMVESDGARKVCRFRLRIVSDAWGTTEAYLDATRIIPGEVMAEVWRRDGGRCVLCGVDDNLHFDHVIPFSKGGTSLRSENIQLLCARHNLSKGARVGA